MKKMKQAAPLAENAAPKKSKHAKNKHQPAARVKRAVRVGLLEMLLKSYSSEPDDHASKVSKIKTLLDEEVAS